jgi:hypothetical protein
LDPDEEMAMPTASRNDPYAGFNFLVEINGIPAAGFSECSGLATDTEVIEYREGSDPANTVRKLPGITRYSPIGAQARPHREQGAMAMETVGHQRDN